MSFKRTPHEQRPCKQLAVSQPQATYIESARCLRHPSSERLPLSAVVLSVRKYDAHYWMDRESSTANTRFFSTGKSSLTVRFVDHHFVESYYPTIENTFSRIIKHKGQDFATEIVDTAGQVWAIQFVLSFSTGLHFPDLPRRMNIVS